MELSPIRIVPLCYVCEVSCSWQAKKDLIYALALHRWIVNHWVVYRDLAAQPRIVLVDISLH